MGKVRSKYFVLVFLFLAVLPFGNAFDNDVSSEEEPECSRLPPRLPNVAPSEKIDLFGLLKEDYQNQNAIDSTNLNHQVDDAILILGNTGSGKTTITQILAGNLSRVHAVVTESGKLVIVDDEERIGGPSTNSKTIRPELVIRYEGNDEDNSTTTTAFYDCPGFDDTRGSEMDIAANFFMNQMLKNVKRVKMLFLVTYSSVKIGNDRLDFDLLATHVTNFVKDLRKYGNSFALVVTKVNSYNDFGRFIKDSQIKWGIVEFLQIYNETLHQKLEALGDNNSDGERENLESKIFFVDTLLQKSKDGAYPKISFSRSPERCGPLEKSVMVAQTRWQLTKMYTDALSYTPVDGHGKDFGYTLKDKTILDIQDYTENLNSRVTEAVKNIVSTFAFWYSDTYFSSKTPNLTKLSRQLDKDSVALKRFVVKADSAFGFENLNDFTESFRHTLWNMGYGPPSDLIESLKQNHLYLDFFQESVSRHKHGQSQLGDPTTWMEPVSRFQDSIQAHRDWYEFLANLEKRLDEYSVHKNRKIEEINAKVKGPIEWLSYIQKESITPIGSHVTTISEKMSSQHLYYLDSLMKMFNTPTEINCAGKNNLTVKGSYVKLSDFVTKKGVVFINDSACDLNTLKLIEVYATHKIFVDRDIQGLGKELSIVLLAPKWTIIGNRTFHLEGSDGPDFEPPKAEKGMDGVGEDGKGGELGNPGDPGGSVFGMALRFDGIGNLKILASGGKGGTGQNGGDGGEGGNGQNAGDVEKSDWNWRSEYLINIRWTARRSGNRGARGGDGGKGGPGGFGGNPGYVDVITPYGKTEGEEKIETARETGQRGANGVGGKGGFGGNDGFGIYCEQKNFLFFIPYDSSCTRDNRSSREGEAGSQGLMGSIADSVGSWFSWGSGGNGNAKLPDRNIDKKRSAREFKKLFGNVENQATQDFVAFIQTRY